jgi:TolB-like protein
MAALIEGFEYDIFISYRQNDNRYDGWVTEFVANLKKELQATFKEEVNVYFDENPHDGLLEIHQVTDSLRNKIKSVIFIPIISQTYCDPKSFAWKYEFLAFKEMASVDQFGLNIKLASSGNVISRIVPVRIHDLDQEDKELLENTTGVPLRTINFIFKAPGVNRPLRAREDHPHDNLDKTYYRDQINKVANLTKEIILSLKSARKVSVSPQPKVEEKSKETSLATKLNKKAWIVMVVITLPVLMFAFYYFKANVEDLPNPLDNRVAIAVLPFKVIGKEDDSQYFADGVMDVILANLTTFPELKVKSVASVEKYRHSLESIPVIAEELKVDYILIGRAQKLGNDIRIVVQLIDPRHDESVWSETFIEKFNNVFEIQSQISASVATSLKAKFTPEISNKISHRPTTDFEAYDLFLRARQLIKRFMSTQSMDDLESSISLLKQSIQKDNQFALAYAWLAAVKSIAEAGDIATAKDSILFLANKAMELDSTLVESYLVLSQVYDYMLDNVQALRFTYKALDSEEDDSISTELIKRLASIYSRIGDVEKSLSLYNELLRMTNEDRDILRLKYFPLAASGNVNELVKLSERLMDLHRDTVFSNLIMTHVWTEQKEDKRLVNLYLSWKRLSAADIELLDHYIFMVAQVLRKNGHDKEAIDLVARAESQIDPQNDYALALLLLFKGKTDQGLQQLTKADIGWYTLSTVNINPLFKSFSNDVRFTDFIRRNMDRINDERVRINHLESNSYLPVPSEYSKVKWN